MSKGRAIVRSLPTHCRGNVHGFGDENKGFGSRERKTSDKQLGAGHKEAGVSGRSAPASADRSVDRPPPQLGSALGRETPEHLCRARRRASSFSNLASGAGAAGPGAGNHWPPGSGKTTLLNVFAIECENARVPHVFLDARSVTPSPQGFLLALQERLKSRDASTSSIVEALKPPSRFVIFIDNYERLYALHDWLCTTFFPGLPSNTAVVMAGRTPPPEPWITDPAWRDLVTRIHLDNFSADESRAYLDRRKVPPNWHDEIIRFSRGHPLALSLLADWCQQQPNDQAGSTLDLGAAPDVMQILVRRFVGDVADSRGRTALEACAILRVTTEAVLAKMLDIPEARDEFEWLCTLSFIDYSPSGIYPHDLVREALTLDLKWRNPDKYRLLRRRALEYFSERLNRLTVEDGEALEDYVYLHRQNLVFRPFLSHPGTETILPKCERATTKKPAPG